MLCKHWFYTAHAFCSGLFLWKLTVKCFVFTFALLNQNTFVCEADCLGPLWSLSGWNCKDAAEHSQRHYGFNGHTMLHWSWSDHTTCRLETFWFKSLQCVWRFNQGSWGPQSVQCSANITGCLYATQLKTSAWDDQSEQCMMEVKCRTGMDFFVNVEYVQSWYLAFWLCCGHSPQWYTKLTQQRLGGDNNNLPIATCACDSFPTERTRSRGARRVESGMLWVSDREQRR